MVTASLVLYNNRQSDIDKVVNSVLKSKIDLLQIIDHSPTDKFKTLVNLSDKIQYLKTDNDGYGKGHNTGFDLSQKILKSEYHIILNPDIYFESSAIDSLISYMDEHKDIGLIMPQVFYPNGDFQYLCKMLPTPADIFLRQFASSEKKEKNDQRYAMKSADFTKIMDVPSLSGCFMFVRTSTFIQVGGFDTRFFMHFEDIDLTRRIGEISRTVYFPGSSIVHAHEAAHKKSKKMLLIGFQSAVKYFNKWGWFFDSNRRVKNKEAQIYLS